MTDTPRTLAALQALLADNATNQISPQDLRDFLVSVMGDNIGATSLFSVDPSITPVANGASVPYKVYAGADPGQTHRYDPLGILQTGAPYVSTFTGLTHAAGSWWSLPVGVWLVRAQIVWSTASSTGTRTVDPGPIDNRQDTPELDHVFWNPGYHSGMGTSMETTQAASLVNANGFGGGFQSYTGVYRVLQSVAPVAFGAWLTQDSGTSLAITSGVIKVMRLG